MNNNGLDAYTWQCIQAKSNGTSSMPWSKLAESLLARPAPSDYTVDGDSLLDTSTTHRTSLSSYISAHLPSPSLHRKFISQIHTPAPPFGRSEIEDRQHTSLLQSLELGLLLLPAISAWLGALEVVRTYCRSLNAISSSSLYGQSFAVLEHRETCSSFFSFLGACCWTS